MPNLRNRYEYSQQKDSAAEETPRMVVPYVPSVLVPCLGGCERMVPTGQKCAQCATDAVNAWLKTRKLK